MKTPLTIALLAVFAAGAATAQMPPDRPRLDSYVAVARHHTARAGLVVDDHALPQRARDLLAHRARRDVGRAARRIGHDDAQRA